MEVEVQDWEWCGLTVHPRGPAHFMLFGPLCPGLELNVTQEQWKEWHSGEEGPRLTPRLKSSMRSREGGSK
ncbi:hypothetical protein CgunFtcFv8_026161 [Champsocephalus gunnari]|uniref:Uncharacterized protein n=1 Tax=Champsocephalus gunnari TaxID=52237 RepID=A0AAN8CCQ0_CHAGU|nr:hypothetical protein CgunFtcFv8_026161 [Champsocephalus gunnari]